MVVMRHWAAASVKKAFDIDVAVGAHADHRLTSVKATVSGKQSDQQVHRRDHQS